MIAIDGIWDCTISTPVGKEPGELTLTAGPDGVVTGTLLNLKDRQALELQEARLDDHRLTWTMQLTKPFKVAVKCEVQFDGQQFSGHGTTMLGKIPLTGTKRA